MSEDDQTTGQNPTDGIDPTATGVDVGRIEHEIEGWGGASTPSHEENELTADQLEHLQDRPEPIGGGEPGGALTGAQGHPAPLGQPDPPEPREPDTSLGHQGHRGRGSAEAPPEA